MQLVYRDEGCVVVMPREQLQSICTVIILDFSTALTYSLSLGNQQYVHFEVLIVDSAQRNPSKVDSAWIPETYYRPVYGNKHEDLGSEMEFCFAYTTVRLTTHSGFPFTGHPTVLPCLF